MNLGIYGAGGLGRELMDLAVIINDKAYKWENIYFIDDSKVGGDDKLVEGVKVFNFEEIIYNLNANDLEIVVAVGEPSVREALREKVEKAGYKLATLIHPLSNVSPSAKIESGAVIQTNCFVSSGAGVGKNVLIQAFCCVGHDAIIKEDSVISSFVVCAGNVCVGERAYVGLSVPIKEGVKIGCDSIIGMGSVVLRDIPDGVIALGNPARAMKNNEDKKVF